MQNQEPTACPVPGLRQTRLFRTQCYLDGRWCGADSGAARAVFNPSTGVLLASVPAMGGAEARRAIEAADRALPAWRARPAFERAAILRRWFDLMTAHREDLARIMTAEQGKPLSESLGEIAYAASFIEWFSEEAKRVYGDVIPTKAGDRRLIVLKQPVGVCASITPWNFPAAMITRKVGPALAAGCTMVSRPASQTPFSALALAALAEEAGVPAGVFSVITGPAEGIVGEMTGNPLVRKITFTGSTEVGRSLMARCAPSVKKLSLELGGNAPFIVFADADLAAAVQGAIASKFRNMGQTCVCTNRMLVQDKVYDAFASKLASAVGSLKVGDGFEPGVQQGPLIDPAAVEKVESHIADARAKGARVLTGGSRHALGGNFFQPTVLADANPGMLIARDETFGPVAPLFRFSTEAEAVALANATEYGLAAYFYGRDVGLIWRVAEALDYGMVGINTGAISSENIPFGGMKQSGMGREGSKYGIESYLEIKYLCLAGLS